MLESQALDLHLDLAVLASLSRQDSILPKDQKDAGMHSSHAEILTPQTPGQQYMGGHLGLAVLAVPVQAEQQSPKTLMM